MSRSQYCAAHLFAGLLLVALTGPVAAASSPADQRITTPRFNFSAGVVVAEVEGPRCRNRRAICRRFVTDKRNIRCLERFGCFTGPKLDY